MPTANAATLAAIETSSQPRSESSSLRLLAEPPHDAREEPEPAEEAERAGLEQRPEPLVVEDVGARAADVSRRRRACRSPRRRAASASTRCSAGPRSASRPLPLAPGIDCCSATSPPAGRNEFLIAPSVPGSTKLDHDQGRDQDRPEPPRLRGRSQRKTSADDDEHHDPRARDGRGAAGDEQGQRTATSGAGGSAARGRAPSGASMTKRGAERDRMLRGAEDAELRGAELQECLGLAVAPGVQERDDAVEVVEDVEPGARLDDREERDDRATDDERLREVVDVVEPPDHARDQVEHEHEAEEEHQVLLRPRTTAARRGPGSRRSSRRSRRRSAAAGPRSPCAGIGSADRRAARRPSRRASSDDEQPVRLELERQVAGQRVAPDRDEEDDEDQRREQARPADVAPAGPAPRASTTTTTTGGDRGPRRPLSDGDGEQRERRDDDRRRQERPDGCRPDGEAAHGARRCGVARCRRRATAGRARRASRSAAAGSRAGRRARRWRTSRRGRSTIGIVFERGRKISAPRGALDLLDDDAVARSAPCSPLLVRVRYVSNAFALRSASVDRAARRRRRSR